MTSGNSYLATPTDFLYPYSLAVLDSDSNYVYLFRSWKSLLTTAQTIQNIWIYSYDKQVEFIKRLHKKLQFSKLSKDELNSFADDLPAFLLKLSKYELASSISANISDSEIEVDPFDISLFLK